MSLQSIYRSSILTLILCGLAAFLARQAKAMFPYTGNTDEELPFEEGDVLNVVDSSADDWWKVEKGGMIFLVPAAYLELS